MLPDEYLNLEEIGDSDRSVLSFRLENTDSALLMLTSWPRLSWKDTRNGDVNLAGDNGILFLGDRRMDFVGDLLLVGDVGKGRRE
jgi:hypothetical protein